MKERILKAMIEKGIESQAELERRAGIPHGTMRNIGQGHMPSTEKIKKIANYLGVSVDYIVNGNTVEEEEQKKDKRDRSLEKKPSNKQFSDPIREFFSLVSSLSDQNMEDLIFYLKYLISRQERD